MELCMIPQSWQMACLLVNMQLIIVNILTDKHSTVIVNKLLSLYLYTS